MVQSTYQPTLDDCKDMPSDTDDDQQQLLYIRKLESENCMLRDQVSRLQYDLATLRRVSLHKLTDRLAQLIHLPPPPPSSTASSSSSSLVQVEERYAAQLSRLSSLGYRHRTLNALLLDSYNGDIVRVSRELDRLS
jgi:hypothetical protein